MSSLKYSRNIGCPTWNYSVVVCRNSKGKYLAVNETRNRGWWLPAGYVDPGESFYEGAIREAKEEAGTVQISFLLCVFLVQG